MEIKVHPSWNAFFNVEKEKTYFKELLSFLEDAYQKNHPRIFPPEQEVFRLFRIVAVTDIKVVVIGQDPYPTFGHANGLAFSLNKTVRPLAKSLINIYKEMASDLKIETPSNGDLTYLVQQGVFLSNTILTVEEGKPLSHQNIGWEKFTTAVLKYILEQNENLVFIIWGNFAKQAMNGINTSNHCCLEAPHPSPLSAYRGFFGCKHFSKTDHFLESVGKTSIRWSLENSGIKELELGL